jgi:anaphase-promoting complex subunit 10
MSLSQINESDVSVVDTISSSISLPPHPLTGSLAPWNTVQLDAANNSNHDYANNPVRAMNLNECKVELSLQPIKRNYLLSHRELHDEFNIHLSSCKLGNGCSELFDNNYETFWQTDSQGPHIATIQFNKKYKISCLAIYLCSTRDESYTPNKIQIKAGAGSNSHISSLLHHNSNSVAHENSLYSTTREIVSFDLFEASGWISIYFKENSEHSNARGTNNCSIRCNSIELLVHGSQQNGRDCHIRQIKIYSPRQVNKPNKIKAHHSQLIKDEPSVSTETVAPIVASDGASITVPLQYSTIDFQQFAELR